MKLTQNDQTFLENLAKSEVGKDLIEFLKRVEVYYADIRNLKGIDANVRVDALKLFREALLDRLLVLSGEQEPPEGEEFV
jgi:hypothetical protein